MRTEGLRLNSRSFRGVRTSSGWGLASPARGPSSTGISMSARRAADWACGVGSGRWVLRERGGSGSSSSSVSYTHLDVYKRQILAATEEEVEAVHAGLRAYNRNYCPDAEDLSRAVRDEAGRVVAGTDSVSYTHLDVYKRQAPSRAAGAPRAFPSLG